MSTEGRTKAISGKVVVGLIVVLITPIPVLWLINSSDFPDAPIMKVVSASPLSLPYADNTYSDAQVVVDNGGNVMAEGCSVRAYNARLFAEDPDNTPALGESEQFDLSPQGGYVATVNIYLPDASEETSQGGVKAFVHEPFTFRAECSNAESL
jgi:hypothetical protein